MEKTICFTGHRPNKMAGYKHENYCSFLNPLEEHLHQPTPFGKSGMFFMVLL